MVALSEVNNMFWGVTLDGGKHYTQTVERGFHISMAALEFSHSKDAKNTSYVSLMIQHEKAEFVLCTLQHGHLLQQPLDLNFTEGEEVTFFLNGKGIVHLTGYLVEDEAPQDMEYGSMDEGLSDEESEEVDSEDYSSEDEAPQLTRAAIEAAGDSSDDEDDEDFTPAKVSGKRKKEGDAKKAAKKAKLEESSSEDDEEEDDDEEYDSDDMQFMDNEADEDSNMDDDDDDGSDLDSEDEEELARLSGSFLQANLKATPQDKKTKEGMGKKGQETPKLTKGTPGKTPKSQLPPSGKKQKDTATPGGKKKGSDTPGEKKKTETPGKKEKQKSDVQTSPASTSELNTSQVNTEKKKKKKNKKNKQKLENGGGDATSNQQTPSQSKSKPGTPVTGQKQQSKPGTPMTGQKPQSKPGTPATGQKPGKPQKKVLEGGVLCEDSKDGHGPPATPGKMVQVYYTGRLENGKVFDSSTTGTPFKFKLGKNEVIRGWDVGVKGMKVGGKRKLTIPAKMAYGNKRAGDIPPGSTLIFDVELKNVS